MKLETFQDPPPLEDLSFETRDGCMDVDLKKVPWSPSAGPVKGLGPAGTSQQSGQVSMQLCTRDR